MNSTERINYSLKALSHLQKTFAANSITLKEFGFKGIAAPLAEYNKQDITSKLTGKTMVEIHAILLVEIESFPLPVQVETEKNGTSA